MTYGDSTDLGTMCTAISDSVSNTLKSLSLEVADTWVNSKVTGVSTTSVPDLVQKAATYYAYAFILRNLYDTSDSEANGILWYEDQAMDLLEAYIGQSANEDSEAHPYSSSLTPTNIYTKRNLRSIEDDLDYENVDDNEWTEDDE